MDREKVIKKAERIMCSTVDRDMIDSFCEDVIAMLKEQEAVVRCKDCKYYDSFSESCRNGIDGIMTQNFYCGNAERKEGR